MPDVNTQPLRWKGVLADPRQYEQYLLHKSPQVDKAIAHLCAKLYRSASLEKLKGHDDLWTIRTSNGCRVMLSPVKLGDDWFLQILDIGFHAVYEKSKYIKPQVLKRYRKTLDTAQLITIMCYEDTLPEASSSNDEEEAPAEFFRHSSTRFNVLQKQALSADLPLLLMGGAGSGKTLVTNSILEQAVLNRPFDDSDFKVLYLSACSYLVAKMKKSWVESPQGAAVADEWVEFKTWQQLLQNFNVPLTLTNTVGKQHFINWYIEYTRAHTRNNPVPAGISPEQMYEELRLRSGYSAKAYQEQGERRQSLLKKADRPRALEVDEDYKAELKAAGLENPDFTLINEKQRYSLIVVDEAHNLSRGALRQLYQLAKEGRIIFCVDPHQIQHDRLSMIDFLLSFPAMNFIKFQYDYRCPRMVAKLANVLTQIKYHLTGGKGHKGESAQLECPEGEEVKEGRVSLLPCDPKVQQRIKDQHANNPDFAVVTDDQYKQEAEKAYGNLQVYNAEEAAGLEFRWILYHRPFDHKIFEEANTFIRKNPMTAKRVVGCAKSGQGDVRYSVPFQRVYTGWTRAQEELLIVQDNNRFCNELLKPLMAVINEPKASSSQEAAAPILVEPTSTWEERESLLREKGFHEQADKIVQRGLVSRAESSTPASSSSPAPVRRASNKKRRAKTSGHSATPAQSIESRLKQLALLPEDAIPERVKKEEGWLNELVRNEPVGFPLFYSLFQEYDKTLHSLKRNEKPHSMRLLFTHIVLNFGLGNIADVKNNQTCLKKLSGNRPGLVLFLGLLHEASMQNAMTRGMWMSVENLVRDFAAMIEPMNKGSRKAERRTQVMLKEVQHPGLDQIIALSAYSAIQNKNLRNFELMLVLGLNVNHVFSDIGGMSLCQLAAQKNADIILRRLLQLKADYKKAYTQGDTAAHIAARLGKSEALSVLACHDPLVLQQQNDAGEYPLTIAIKKENWALVECFVGEGRHGLTQSEINTLIENSMHGFDLLAIRTLKALRCNMAKAPIYSVRNNMPDSLQYLNAIGIDFYAEDEEGNTAAHVAAELGYVEMLERLEAMKLEINRANSRGITPLKRAIASDQAEVLEFMYSRQVSLSCSADNAEGAIHLAANAGAIDVIWRLRYLDFDLDERSQSGQTAAHIAAQNGDELTLRTLHECGADLTLPNSAGFTVELIAAQFGFHLIIELLIELDFKLNQVSAKNINGFTAIHLAAYMGQIKVLKCMRDHDRSSFASRTPVGATVAHTAVVGRQDVVIRFLHDNQLCDFSEVDKRGLTPGHLAATVDSPLPLIELGACNPAYLCHKSRDGVTSLRAAAAAGMIDRFRILASFEAVVMLDGKNQIEHCAVVAAEFNHADILECILAEKLARVDHIGQRLHRIARQPGFSGIRDVLERHGIHEHPNPNGFFSDGAASSSNFNATPRLHEPASAPYVLRDPVPLASNDPPPDQDCAHSP